MHPYPTFRLTESPGFQETRLEARPTREAARYQHRSHAKRALRRRLKRSDRQRAILEEQHLAALEAQQEQREWELEEARFRDECEIREAWDEWPVSCSMNWGCQVFCGNVKYLFTLPERPGRIGS